MHDEVDVARIGQRERTQRGDVLAVDVETFAAGRQDPHTRARRAARGRRAGRPARSRCSQLSSTHSSSRLRNASAMLSSRRRADALLHRERGRDDAEHRVGLAGRRELRHPRAVAELGNHVGRDLQREAGLADAADAGQRHESVLGDALCRRGSSSASRPTNVVSCDGRLVGKRVERTQRREVVGEAVGHDLVHAFGPREVAQPVLAQVAQRDRALVAQHRGRRVGDQDLAAVARSP